MIIKIIAKHGDTVDDKLTPHEKYYWKLLTSK